MGSDADADGDFSTRLDSSMFDDMLRRNRQWTDETTQAAEQLEASAGHGHAAGGQVRATVSGDGRIAALYLDPALLRLGRYGPVTDTATLAREITKAVNAAIDDLQHTIGETEAGALQGFEANLDQITTNLDTTLDRIATDVARAEHRLD